MLDKTDLALLNLVQRDASMTADALSTVLPLSPSALARRLRGLRKDGWITRTISLLSPRLMERRLRAIVTLQLAEHADQRAKTALLRRIGEAPQVQFCYELAGVIDFLMLLDCDDMTEFNDTVSSILESDSAVRRYETMIVKRTTKFAPFARLSPRDFLSE